MPNSRVDGPAIYQIKVSGHLDRGWSAWLSGVTITYESESNDVPTTTLTGPVADQSALRGILAKLWDLNLVLISLTQIKQGSNMVKRDED